MTNGTTNTPVLSNDRVPRLAGKVAVITGASSGIGEATARELARLGASVVLAARRLDRLEAVVADIRMAGGTAHAVVTDTTKTDDLKRMVNAALDQYGRLDYAVNNAGASGRGAFMDVAVEDFDHVMETNLRGVFLAMQVEIPVLLQSGGGAIVNTASVGGLVGVPGLSSYVASKWALIGLTKSVALEYATKNIRINAIAPGATATEMSASWTPEQREFMAGLAPMKRICEPIEIARGIVYLLADATFTTGIALPADGGQSVP
ncbi:SDR family NAD(P)-dependent oxidoreductase [Caballeronia sp. 15715]|uniref:SDR family NAD(P)-dependent oxidoreductase n=1 Tax=Caballeronia sp. 15715 TaxID=3391030 RepID=UPI0039E47146